MPAPLNSYKAALLATGALAAASIGYAVTASGVSPSEPASSCRASLLRVSIAGETVLEPVVANDADSPCSSETAGIGTLPLEAIPVDLTLLYAETSTSAPQAKAGVLDLTIHLSSFDPALPDISAQLLKSEASATCNGTTLTRSGSSRVVGLQIGDQGGELPPGDEYTDIDASPLVRVQLNEQDTSTPGTLTQRALHVTALPGAADIDIVVAESQVDTTGNPCDTGSTTGGTTGSTTGATTGSTTGATTGGTTGATTGGAGPVVGWMNGGGQLPGSVTHSLVLPCTKAQKHPKPHLQVEAPTGKFTLTTLGQVGCSMVPANGDPEQPDAGFNTLTGQGTGTCNGHKNVDASFTFTDGGEPNRGRDKATVTIDKDNKYGCHVAIAGATVNGNHQAHRGNNPPA